MFKYTCFVYGLLSLLSIGLNSGTKNHFLGKFCFWYGKCHNSIIISKLCLLKNQINSENFKYCKERREGDWAEIFKTDNQSKAWIHTWKIGLLDIATFLPSLPHWRWVHVWLVISLELTLLYTLHKINYTSELIRVKLNFIGVVRLRITPITHIIAVLVFTG